LSYTCGRIPNASKLETLISRNPQIDCSLNQVPWQTNYSFISLFLLFFKFFVSPRVFSAQGGQYISQWMVNMERLTPFVSYLMSVHSGLLSVSFFFHKQGCDIPTSHPYLLALTW